MKRIENQTFDFMMDESSGSVFADIEFSNCQFIGGGFSSISVLKWEHSDLVALRSTAKRIKFFNCRVDGVSFIGPGIVEDSVIDGLKVSNHLQTSGTVFKHVVIKGAIDKLMLTPNVDFTGGTFSNIQKKFDNANRDYYENVDWALDISEGLFRDCDIRAIPSRLIKRDPETQVVLTREKAMEGAWREVDLSGTYWAGAINLFLEDGYQDRLLIAPKKGRNFRKLLEGINKLRKAGVVD